MAISRRELFRISGVAAAVAVMKAAVVDARQDGPEKIAATGPVLGLIFPPLNYPIPPDARRLYPQGVEFLGNGVGLPGGMTLQGYDEAIPRVIPAAQALAAQGAKVISVFGSSL